MKDATDPSSVPPQLPADLDDLGALDDWYSAWNDWATSESVRKKWHWLKPMTPATLHDILEIEKRWRIDRASAQNQDAFASKGNNPERQHELTEARAALIQLENRLTKADAGYEAKKALLVPILRPLFKDLPPARWAVIFKQAYDALSIPVDSATPSVIKANPKTYEGNANPELLLTSNVALPGNDAGPEITVLPAAPSLKRRTRAQTIWGASVRLAAVSTAYFLMAWILTRVFPNLDLGTACWYLPVGILGFQMINWLTDELTWRSSGKSSEVNGALYFFSAQRIPDHKTLPPR